MGQPKGAGEWAGPMELARGSAPRSKRMGRLTGRPISRSMGRSICRLMGGVMGLATGI